MSISLFYLQKFFLPVIFNTSSLYQYKNRKQLQQKKLMTQSYSNLCQNLNRYTLSQLNNTIQGKYKSVFQNKLTENNKTPSLIKVVSPFYQKSKCIRKGPCFCAYHRQKKSRYLNSNSIVRNNTAAKENFFPLKNIKNNRRFCTQSDQKAQINHDLLKISNQKQKKQINFSLDKYENIPHKVHCRNSEFQQFLKKNQLYILTGKLPIKLKEDDNQLLDQKLLQDIFKNLQNYSNEARGVNFQRSLKRNLTQYNLNSLYREPKNKKSQKQIEKLTQKLNSIQILRRLKKVIQFLINGRKKMSLQKMKKLRQAFAGIIKKQKQTNNEIIGEIGQLQECLAKFDRFLSQYLDEQQQQRYDIIQVNLTFKERKKSGTKSIHKKNENQNIKVKKNLRFSQKVINQSQNLNRQQSQIKNTKQNGKTLHKQNNNFEQSIHNQLSQNQERQDQNNILNIQQRNQNRDYDQFHLKNLKKTLNSKYTKKKILHYKMVHGINSFREQFLDKKQPQNNKQQSNLTLDYFNNSRYRPIQNKIKERVDKIKQTRNNPLKNQETLDKNYLRMKKCIERNRKFIKKMETKLHDLQLDLFIIQPSDSLITKKKKIRYLRQILENNDPENRKNGFYEEIIRYLDIYTEHCNMVMKKDMRKRNNDDSVYLQEDIQFQELNKDKDFTNSLKFIDLHENVQSQREKRLEGWISIPQYITNGQIRSKLQKIQLSLNKNKIILKQKPQLYYQQSEDSLIQVQLKDQCTVKKYNYNEIVSNAKNKDNKLKQSKGTMQKFNQKISQLKKKFRISNFQQN